eukprot:CAMPEP_0185030666 /NCGR_PEP_ID=MMETSP1103-20130426/17659_1 /TAXON_ID=36769 /ORGANISM="Paraphysomonas bandaiensis, Strain Caron Lab Isolate" /LENGTH=265 /DNA_ID=CAMNT_0027565879 /DNA_START=478 /DNA_END=1272 /DNA_ORIENTATION=+
MTLLLPSIGILILAAMSRKHFVDNNGECHFGLQDRASVPLIVYDASLSLVTVSQFMFPLIQFSPESKTVNTLAFKNLIGSLLSLSTTFSNLLTHTLAHGHQPSSVCFLWCLFDVGVDAVVINWLMVRPKETVAKEVSEVVLTVMEDAVVNVIFDQNPIKPSSHSSAPTEVPLRHNEPSPKSINASHSPSFRSMIPYFIREESPPSVFSPSFRTTRFSTPPLSDHSSRSSFHSRPSSSPPAHHHLTETLDTASNVAPSFDQWQNAI